MRKDEQGNVCPETLGEYRSMCAALGGEGCQAVVFLDEKIKDLGGQDVTVAQHDLQMRALLMPILID